MQIERKAVDFPTGCHRSAIRNAIRAVEGIKAGLASIYPPKPIEWLESTINLDADPSAVVQGMLKVSPWQVDPIRAQMIGGNEVTISAPEQSGKSMSWKLGAIYKARYLGGSMLTVYEEREKAFEINKKTFHPLLCCVPEFAEMDKSPKFLNKNKYNFFNGWLEFLGAGVDITSQSFKYIHADELDTWPLTTPKRRSQVANLRKRWRTFQRQNIGSYTKCSSIKGTFTDSTIWQELANSDLGIYHLKCKGCNELTINSTIHKFSKNEQLDRWTCSLEKGVLQYDLDQFDEVIEDSCKVVCPKCDHEHRQKDLLDMCSGSDQYIKQQPRIKKHRGFLIGGLACDRAMSLFTLCKAYNRLLTENDYEAKRTIVNSFFGVPLEVGFRSGEMDEILESHCLDVYPERYNRILMGADSQKSPYGWYYVIRGYDDDNNSYLLDYGFLSELKDNGNVDRLLTRKALENKLNDRYYGQKIDYCIIDAGGGGEGTDAVKDISKRKRNVFMYKGGNFKDLYTESKSQKRLLNCSAKIAAEDLLYKIYNQHDKEGGEYWYIPEFRELEEEYLEQVLNIDPDNDTSKDKKIIDNKKRWDYFDCEKMVNLLSKYKTKRVSVSYKPQSINIRRRR
jgi:phage terminase large subunit GpA-like protein